MSEPRYWPRQLLPGLVTLGAVWSVAPLPIWLVGTAESEFTGAWSVWFWGAAISVGTTTVLLILSRRRAAVWLLEFWRRGVGSWSTTTFLAVVAGSFAALALLFTLFVFAGNPRNVDGFAQLFQARIFLAGRLWIEPPHELAHFGTLHMILGPERWFSQYPPGQSAVLAAGLALGGWWMLNPLFGAALVAGTYRVAKWTAGETTGRLAAVLLCLSPFALAVAGSEMSHLPAAALGVGAAASATALGGGRWRLAALGAGALLGVMTAFRPLDAVAATVPVALVTVLAARRRLWAFALIFVGGSVGSLPTLWFNARTTGHWSEFGYTHLWGPLHSLGFHGVPWGVPLTPARAIGLTGLDLHQLNRYLFDFPFPVLLLVAAAYVLGRRVLGVRDALPVAGVMALMGLLFFYWHRDVFYGPRFLYSTVSWMVVIVARAVHLLRHERNGGRSGGGGLTALTAVTVALVVGTVSLTPWRIAAYRDSTPTLNFHPDRDAARAEIHNAVVLIPDGWGSRLINRMWALGVPVRRSTRLYAAIDACTLHRALDEAERGSATGADLSSRLAALAALGRPGAPAGVTGDRNLRIPTWEPLAPQCVEEIGFDRRGFLAFAPYLYLNNATLDGDVVWARDMRSGNAVLAARYPGRRFYRYEVEPGGRSRFTRMELRDGTSTPR